jgi:hypothetical protein
LVHPGEKAKYRGRFANRPRGFGSFFRRGGNLPGELNPASIAELSAKVPGLQIIIAHMGGNWTKTAHAIKDCPNIYTDVSGGPPVRGSVETCVEILGAERVLFGSDCICRSIPSQLAKVIHADLSGSDKKLIPAENALKLFGKTRIC